MRVLAIGDIIGESGMKKMREVLPKLIKEESIDFIIANGENTAEGMGITENIFKELLALGVDVVTLGNHTWAKRDVFKIISHTQLLRPENYAKNVPGHGYGIYECNGKRIAVVNMIGRVDINVLSENPFIIGEELVGKLKNKADIIIIDFHAEATAEKIAFLKLLDGKVTAIVGTHTHVQTADERVTDKGTAYITDLGMTGPIDSVIGMDVVASVKRFLTSLPERYKSAEGESCLNCCIIDINDENCRPMKITRINS